MLSARCRCDVQQVGDLRVRPALEIVEQQYLALSFREVSHGAGKPGIERLGHGMVELARSRRHAPADHVEPEPRPDSPPALKPCTPVQGRSPHDRSQPGAEPFRLVATVERSPDLDDRILRDVFRDVGVGRVGEGDDQGRGRVAAHELIERRPIPGSRGLHEPAVRDPLPEARLSVTQAPPAPDGTASPGSRIRRAFETPRPEGRRIPRIRLRSLRPRT